MNGASQRVPESSEYPLLRYERIVQLSHLCSTRKGSRYRVPSPSQQLPLTTPSRCQSRTTGFCQVLRTDVRPVVNPCSISRHTEKLRPGCSEVERNDGIFRSVEASARIALRIECVSCGFDTKTDHHVLVRDTSAAMRFGKLSNLACWAEWILRKVRQLMPYT